MTYKGFFIDDTVDEGIYASLLSSKGPEGLEIEYVEVSEAAALAGDLFSANPDLVAIDFRLDENPDMIDPKNAYQGSGLAQLLRDKAIIEPLRDFPVVLISAEEKFERYYRPDSTAHDLFDRTYGKVSAGENREQVRLELLSLCDGYRRLKAEWHEGGNRLSVFGLHEAERGIVDTQELRSALSVAAAPHIAARVILRDVVDRTGVLLSDQDLAARLGLAILEPLVSVLQRDGLQYSGIFHGGWRRWWSHRVDDWAEAIFGRRPVTMLGSERCSIIEEKYGIGIASAKSTWNNSDQERFSFACASCKRPGEVRHSVTVFDPVAPRYTQRRRICWDCVQTEKYRQCGLAIDEVDEAIAQDVLKKNRDDVEDV